MIVINVLVLYRVQVALSAKNQKISIFSTQVSLECLKLNYNDIKMACLGTTSIFISMLLVCSFYAGWTGSNFEWLILK